MVSFKRLVMTSLLFVGISLPTNAMRNFGQSKRVWQETKGTLRNKKRTKEMYVKKDIPLKFTLVKCDGEAKNGSKLFEAQYSAKDKKFLITIAIFYGAFAIIADMGNTLTIAQDVARHTRIFAVKNNGSKMGGSRADGSYSVNLMWINRSLNATQTYICPDGSNQAYGKNSEDACLTGVFKWANVSQGSTVNFWYDSALTPAQAVNNTQALIEERASKHPEWAPIALRDIREIPKVAMHPEVFSDKTSVYFRSDLLRPIMALHLLSRSEVNYFVYCDVDIKTPLSQKQLFDNETLHNLQEYGIVMGPHAENGFQIISNQKHNLLKAMDFVIIELNMKRAYNALQGNFRVSWEDREVEPTKALGSAVYHNYPDMFQYFLFLEGRGPLICNFIISSSTKKKLIFTRRKYKTTDGLTPYGLTYMYAGLSVCECKLSKGGMEYLKSKKVDLPPLANIGNYE